MNGMKKRDDDWVNVNKVTGGYRVDVSPIGMRINATRIESVLEAIYELFTGKKVDSIVIKTKPMPPEARKKTPAKKKK